MIKKFEGVSAALDFLIAMMFIIAAVIATQYFSVISDYIFVIILAIIIITLLSIIYRHYEIKNKYYTRDIELDTVDVYRGILFKSYSKYPIRRIQNVGLQQGPLLKFCQLATVELINGGELAKVEYVKLEEAEALVTEITKLLNRKLDEN